MSKKVLLIYPGTFFSPKRWDIKRDFQPQLFILYSFLKENGVDVEVLEFGREGHSPQNLHEINKFQHSVKKVLSRCNFDIVGISCYITACYSATIAVARICKEINKDCTVVVGGYHPTAVPDDFIAEERLFDFVVRGEGEIALLEICQGKSIGRQSSPKIIEGVPRDLKEGVYLDWEDYRYIKRNSNHVGLIFARGCPFKCNYCADSLLKFEQREYPVDLALRDIKKAVDVVHPRSLRFEDPLFPIFSPWGQELLQALAREKFETPIRLSTRIDLLNVKHIELLSKFNAYPFFGIETCSERMLTIMNKTKNPKGYLEKVEENLSHLNEQKILADIGLLFNHPGDTDECVDETIAFLNRVLSKKNTISVKFYLNQFIYFPGTYISENLAYFEKEFGTIVKHKTWWKEDGDHFELSLDVIPSREAPNKVQWKSKMEQFLETFMKKKIDNESLLFKLYFDNVLYDNKAIA